MLLFTKNTASVVSWLACSKEYKIGICCFSTKHAASRKRSKDWLVWNQDVFEWATCLPEDYSVSLKYQILNKPVGLVQNGNHYHLIECNLFLA